MATWTKLFLSLACCASLTSGFIVIKFGKCPQPSVKRDFDVNQYIGKWWEYERFPAPFEFDGKCGFANYTLLSPTEVEVFNSGIQETKFWIWTFTKPIDARGKATILDPSEPAKLRVDFDGMPQFSDEVKPNYWVVDTDYTQFSVVYSCQELIPGFLNSQITWILTRQRGVQPSTYGPIYRTLKGYGIDTNMFMRVDQTNCKN